MDQWAGSLVAMFDFGTPARTDLLILDPETGIQAMRGCLPSPALRSRFGRRLQIDRAVKNVKMR